MHPDLPYNVLMLLVDAFVVRRMLQPPRTIRWGWIAGAMLVGMFAAVPLSHGLFHRLRLLTELLFLHFPSLLLIGAFLDRGSRPRHAVVAATLAAGVLAVGADAFLIEPRALGVTRFELSSAEVPVPLRVVVLSDLQADRVGSYERRALELALGQDPDLLLLPGDYLQVYGPERAPEEAALRALLAELVPEVPLGIWAVGGNVDPPGWESLFDGTTIRTFPETRTVRVNDWLTITGLSLEASFGRPRIPRGQAGFHVLFGHAPDFALADNDADLMVAGHTHGGQVVLPLLGPPFTLSRVPRSWASGWTRLSNERHLVVSRGVGMERGLAPRMRFLCRPEIVVIDVVPLEVDETV